MSITVSKNAISLVVEAMEIRDTEGIYSYIDRETGEVLTGGRDCPLEILPDEEDEDYEEKEAEFDRRYLRISHSDSSNEYQDMVDFIETVEDERLQDLLEVAIQGKGAFGRFKGVLRRSEYESERCRWFEFSDKRKYDRAVEWLSTEDFSTTA